MNKLTSFSALAAASLIGSLSASAWSDDTLSTWSDETITYGPATPAEQTPAPASDAAPGVYTPPAPGVYTAPATGGYQQTWQQPQWRAPQQFYGQYPPRYPQGGQYPAYPAAPAAPATARENPLTAELKQTREALTAKSSELDEALGMLEQLQGKLQESLATETRLSDKIAYNTREQQALRVRVTELNTALNTANATLEQQHQLINNHQAQNAQLTAERDQLDEQLAALRAELQTAAQSLAQASSRADAATEALVAARIEIVKNRDALSRLEAELERQETRLQADSQTPTE